MKRALFLLFIACKTAVPVSEPAATSVDDGVIAGHDQLLEDTSPKVQPRILSGETYLRSYLALFSTEKPNVAARSLKFNGLFDNWSDYLGVLGIPDYKVDIPRNVQTNALMLATFERMGIALCARSAENELRGVTPKHVYNFDLPTSALDEAGFDARFDTMHRLFLGYPLALAPAERAPRFFKLYQDREASRAVKNAANKYKTGEAGWAAVCYALIRHPEFHTY